MSIWDEVKNVLPAINPGLFSPTLFDREDLVRSLGAINPTTMGPAALYEEGGSSGGPRVGALTNQDYQDIINRINAGAGKGTYGEGIIQTGLQEFRELQNRYRSGELTGEEYSQIAGAILPTLRDAATTLGGGGSRAANALWAAGGQELLQYAKDYDIMKYGQDLMGRPLTIQEIDQFRPYFEGSDTEGRAALAEFARQEEMSPAGLARKAPKYYDQSKDLISQLLGRDARQDELDFYGRQLASGVTPYELRSYIEQTPEYRTAADQKFRGGLASELEGYDKSFFDKAQDSVISRYAKMGTQHSPALDLALTNLMGDIARERGSYLAKVSADQYGGNKQAAREDYLGTMDRYLRDRDYARGRSDQLTDRYYGRATELKDYDMMKRDYFDAMGAGGGKQKFPWGQAVGLAAGAATGNPAWASVGMGGGGLFDYYNR